MANGITLVRFILLYVLVGMAYQEGSLWQLANFPLLVVIFILDGIDGYVARKRHEESLFGAIFDIAVDRIVENVLWLVLADLNVIPVWVAIVFVTRGFLVDSVRAHGASRGETPFGMMTSQIGKFLVAGRFMRIFYAVLKGTAFGYIFMIQPWEFLYPAFYIRWHVPLELVKEVLVYVTVALCVARGLPVILEFALQEDGLFAALRGHGSASKAQR
ncbi:MAG: CDP-alcohol phosphatidyltransferase family protein [Candidatus Pacebacteria bacterium]|nr:CDP-alcohol phosphatidyltransferase family protein [Candidatus Paceibacterota bacterium]